MSETLVFPVKGDFDAAAVRDLRPKLDHVVDHEEGKVVLDLTDVSFIDSSGIGAVVFLYKRLVAKGREFAVRGLNGQPKELFAYLRIDRNIPIENSERTI